MSERGMRRAHAKRVSRARRAARPAAGAVLGATVLFAPSAKAAEVPVTNLNDIGAGSLRDAVSTAAAGDTITFAPGLTGTINAASEIGINKALTIQGPGASTITVDGADTNRIFNVGTATPGDPVIISGLTLANGSAGADSGGAILATNTYLTLNSVTVRDSEAGASSGNVKYDGGGGGVAVFGNSSSLKVTDSRIANNTSADYGGGIETAELLGKVSITGSTLTGNTAAEYGGGLVVYDQTGNVEIVKSTISGNDGGVRDGGGVWFEDVYSGGSVTVSDSTISGNTTDRAGGGISFGENFSGPVKVVSTTVSGNSAGDGGGIQFADLDGSGSFALANSTVSGNSATNSSGGILRGYQLAFVGASQSGVAVTSTIIAGNSAANGSPDVGQNPGATGTLNLANSLLQDTSGATYADNPAGSSIIGVNPMLGSLGDNGGPTQTRIPSASSPVIDAGLASGLTLDQRGLARTVDYPDVAATHGSDGTDIGAAELQLPPPPSPPDPVPPDPVPPDPVPPDPAPDTEVTDPVITASSPQLQGNRIKVALTAGAGEVVTARASGRIRAKRGFPVDSKSSSVAANQTVELILKPRDDDSIDKIQRSLAKGKKVTAELRASLKDAAGNVFRKTLKVELGPEDEK